MFQSIENVTKTDIANAAIEDVTQITPPKTDRMESFWLAETLKYFYLIFSEPDLISLDDYVLYVLPTLALRIFPVTQIEILTLLTASSMQEHGSTSISEAFLADAWQGFSTGIVHTIPSLPTRYSRIVLRIGQ